MPMQWAQNHLPRQGREQRDPDPIQLLFLFLFLPLPLLGQRKREQT